MSSRLRTLDSKISFFAFADIITAVSGVLIFVALLLATDLGRPTKSHTQSDMTPAERQLEETLKRQLELDAKNQRLEELLATAETSPDPAKLQADIASLRAQLSREQRKQSSLKDQMAASEAALVERDKALGLTDLKATVARLQREITAITSDDAAAREKMEDLEGKVEHADTQLLKLHQRQNQVWLIPEKSLTTKEPLLVTVDGTGVAIDRFDRPDQQVKITGDAIGADFISYLHKSVKTNDQYFVFLVKPSGVATFNVIVNSAREQGFEVGYDALEENRVVHFGKPPPIDETTPAPSETTDGAAPGKFAGPGGAGTPGKFAAGQSSRPGTGPGGRGGSVPGTGSQGDFGAGPGGAGGTLTGAGGSGGNGAGAGGAGAGGTATGAGGPGGSPGGTGEAHGPATNGNGHGSSATSAAGRPGGTGTATNNAHGTTITTAPATPPPAKSWWQRLLEWLGFK